MHDLVHRHSLDVPSELEMTGALERARLHFHRVLGAWAGDTLELRREGAHEASWGEASEWPGSMAA